MKRPAELSDVPLVMEFARNADEIAFLQIYTVGTEIGRSLAAPPGVPNERVQVWRHAFMKMLESSEFKEALMKGNVRLDPLDGGTLASRIAEVANLPAETIVRAREFYDHLLTEVR